LRDAVLFRMAIGRPLQAEALHRNGKQLSCRVTGANDSA